MKKALSACFLFILILCGCAGALPPASPPQPTIPVGFEGDCNVVCRDMEIQAHISRPNAQSCLITVTAPESLNGVTVDYTGGALSLTYGIIKQTLDIKKIPQAAFAPAVIHALDEIAGFQPENALLENGNYILNIASEYGDITAVLDGETGAIKTVEIPSQEVKITFTSFAPQGVG